uniref:Glycerophosphodiester phosphodiesterase domain containing 4 n=1 Tax=Strix occidentalis caurina TaxID=311401 RepID=A0A8D0ETA9_STROC
MEASSTSLKRLKFGKLKVVRRRLLQRYEHQPFISCLAGFYSCRWKRYQRRRTEPGKSFCFSLVFLYMWGEAKNDYNNFDCQAARQTCTLLYGLTLAFLLQILSVVQVIIVGPYLAILLFLFLIPLGMYSPCIREMGTLGPKPALIGHRGAPMLAPENTEMSFQKTIEYGGDGLETDVTISYDGVPFLMHDSTLRRTTNIKEVYPNDTTQNAALFSWDTLQELNAGMWFLKDKPFSCMGSLSRADQNQAMNQSIYKLSNFLRLADSQNKLVIFDLYRPPEKHPYRNSWINRTLEVILNESGIRPSLVLWLENDMRSFVQSVAPGFQQTVGSKAPVEDLLLDNIVKLNLAYTEMSSEDIRKYAEANITTNLYVVNEPWLFSLAWCSGAHSVTTNAVHTLKNLSQPLFLMVSKNPPPPRGRKISISKLLKHLTDVRSSSFSRASHCPSQTWSCSTRLRETTIEITLPCWNFFHILCLFPILPWTTCRAKEQLGHWFYQSPCSLKVTTLHNWLHTLKVDFMMLPSRQRTV